MFVSHISEAFQAKTVTTTLSNVATPASTLHLAMVLATFHRSMLATADLGSNLKVEWILMDIKE